MIISAAFTGLTNAFAKPLIDIEGFQTMEISPIALVAMIYLINALFFTPFTKNSVPVRTIGRRNMFFLVLIGIAEVSALMTYFFGLKETTAINSAILSEGEMIFSLLIAVTILRERLRRKELTPFAMIILGMVLIPVGIDLYENGFTLSNIVFGDCLILISGLFYALDINLCKYVAKRLDARRITQISSLVSGIFAVGLMVMFNIPFNVDWSQVPSIVLLSIIGTGLAAFLFIIALRLIGAIRTLLIYSTSAAFGVIFSSIFLGEAITIANVVSITLVMGGIFLLRNRLSEDDSYNIEKSPETPSLRKIEKLPETPTLRKIEKLPETPTLRKIEPIARHTIVNRKGGYAYTTASEPVNNYSYSLDTDPFKIIYHNKKVPRVNWKSKNPAWEKNFERLNDRSTKKWRINKK